MSGGLWPALRAVALGLAGRQGAGTGESEEALIHDEVRAAWRDYEAAHAYFNLATEPDLVEVAVHRLEAACKRYAYCLRRAREHCRWNPTCRGSSDSPPPRF